VGEGEVVEVLEWGLWCTRETVYEGGPGLSVQVCAHGFDGKELEVAVGLACAAVGAGVEEGE